MRMTDRGMALRPPPLTLHKNMSSAGKPPPESLWPSCWAILAM